MKTCTKCKTQKQNIEFNIKTERKDGLDSICRQCSKEHYLKNRDRIIEQQKINKQNENQESKYKRKKYHKEYYNGHKEEIKQIKATQKDIIRARSRKWYLKNRDNSIQSKNNYQKQRMKNDPLFKLMRKIRSLIKQSVKRGNYFKHSRTYEYLCCSFEEFQSHLGPQPSPTHQLDHICPCAQAKNEEELIRLQHYKNFQWLSKEENGPGGKWYSKTPEGESLCKSLLGRDWVY